MNWVKNLSQRRTANELAGKPPAENVPAEQQVKPAEKKAVDLSDIQDSMVGAKVLAEHGAVLKPYAEDMNALASAAEDMEGWRANQFGRAVERFYAALGKQLTATPPKDRPDVASAAIKALRTLVEEVKNGELASPAVSAMTDLISWTGRKEPGKEKKLADSLATIAAIRENVSGLIAQMEGRAGVGTALNVYSSLISMAEKMTPNLAPADRFALWSKVSAFMAEASPKPRVDQVGVAELAQFLGEAIPNAKGDPAKALDLAKQRVYAKLVDHRAAAYAQIKAEPENFAADGPSRAVFDAMTSALTQIVDANAAGPVGVIDHVLILKQRVLELAPNATEDQVQAYRDVAKILENVAATPVAEPVMQYLIDHLIAIAVSEPARAVLAEVAGKVGIADIAVGLIRVHAGAYGGDVAQLERGMEAINKLPPALAMKPALALLPRLQDVELSGPLATAIASYVRHAGAGSLDTLGGFADRFAAVHATLKNMIGEQAAAAAAAIAGTSTTEPISPELAQRIGQLAASVQNIAGDVPIAKLMLPDRDNRPGLLALLEPGKFRTDPQPLLFTLLPAVARAAGATESQKIELARKAIHIAAELGKLDRDPATVLERIRADLEAAIVDPNQLHFALKAFDARGGARGAPRRPGKEQELKALQFANEHAAFPVEVVFTSGIHLNGDQNTWIHEQMTTTKSRAHVRALRDLVFACVEAGRIDAIEALRTSQSTPKAVASAITYIAQEYRGGRLAQVPFDRIVQALAEKKDPIEELTAEKAAEALAALNLQDLAGVKADPAGLAYLQKYSSEITSLIAYIADPFRAAVIDVVRSIASGTWPNTRYEGDIAKRQLAALTPKQLAIWKQEMVTPAAAQVADVPPDPELLDAMSVLKGLMTALPKEVKLGGAGLPALDWNKESRDVLRATRDQLLAQLRDEKIQKGTPEHKDLSNKLRPVNQNLAALELFVALQEAFKQPVADPRTTILDLKGVIEASAAGIRKLGGKGCAAALATVAGVAPEVKTSPRQGLHIADEDHIGAWLTSYNGGSCVNPTNGENRRALAEFLSTPQYRMLRVCDGERGITRGQLRLMMTDIEGVKRPAIWADIPYGVDHCAATTDDQQKLFYKHALAKAQAMGLPLIFHQNLQGPVIAAELGYEVKQLNVVMHVDYGRTGLHQAEAMGPGHYWIQPPAGGAFACDFQGAGVVLPRE